MLTWKNCIRRDTAMSISQHEPGPVRQKLQGGASNGSGWRRVRHQRWCPLVSTVNINGRQGHLADLRLCGGEKTEKSKALPLARRCSPEPPVARSRRYAGLQQFWASAGEASRDEGPGHLRAGQFFQMCGSPENPLGKDGQDSST